MHDDRRANFSDNGSNNDNRAPQGSPPNKPDDNFDWGKIIRMVMVWGFIIVAAVVVMQLFKGDTGRAVEIKYKQYERLLNEDKIETATITKSEFNDYYFKGELGSPTDLAVDGKGKTVTEFVVYIPEPMIEEQEKLWAEKGLDYSFDKESGEWINYLVTMLPWILIIVVWIFFMRRMQGGGAGGQRGLFNFGKSKAKLINQLGKKATFKDVAGADEAKYELEEVIEFLKEPSKFQKLGGKIPKGVLLLGPPGTGKTLLARAVAGEAGVPFFSISGADFVEMFVGVGASRVRDLFEQGKRNAPCIIFIDEIDAVGRHRGAGLGGGHDEREQTLNQLLVEMDGFEQNSGVIIIAATNRPDVLDPALLRPGRFDRQVVVDRPDVRGREGILRVHTRKIPLDDNVNLKDLARGTPGLAGAELANLVNEAALLAARDNKAAVDMRDFDEAKDKVLMGMERKSLIISDEEKKTTAYHEVGHALVAMKLPDFDPVHKVTIIPRGRALGVTAQLPIDEKHNYSAEFLRKKIMFALGGRAAEDLIFKQFTTGAGNDIERATGVARKMVCEWGMSEKLGPLSFGANQEEIFLGKEIQRSQDYSEKTAIEIDDEIRALVVGCYHDAKKILEENLELLHKISDELLKRESLDKEELDALLRGEELPPLADVKNGEEVPAHVKRLMKNKSGKGDDDDDAERGDEDGSDDE